MVEENETKELTKRNFKKIEIMAVSKRKSLKCNLRFSDINTRRVQKLK